MSQTSASEPAIMATQVGVLENLEEETEAIKPHKPKSQEALVKRQHRSALNTSTVSETSDHSSSLLWTPAQPLTKAKVEHTQASHHRSHRKKHKSKRSLYKDEKTTESGETSAFLSKQGQENNRHQAEKLWAFERDYRHNRSSSRRKNGNISSGRHSTRRSNKKHQELCNDYTRYQYHRRSRRDRHRKYKSRSEYKEDAEASATSGLPKIIKRLKDFFFGKKTEEEQHHGKKSPKDHHRKHFEEHSRKHKQNNSGKLFRSASDSDLEVVKHHHRRAMNKKHEGVKDDFLKPNKHWKSRHHDHKLSSICEGSDRSGKLGSGSDAGRLVLARSGRTTYNDIAGHKNGDVRRANGHCKKEDKDTSEGSHSMESSHSKRRYRRRSKEYQSLKKKWVKQHQSFENDLEKLEKLVELIGMKKTQGWLEQKSSENTTLLERLEATQEKCVAEVDFTRHVLICKLQRLENKLEESLSTIDYNNNNTLTDNKGRSVEEIRDEMSKEYRDLRKLLQETSIQLKQVLDEKPLVEGGDGPDDNDGQMPQGFPSPQQKRLSGHKHDTKDELNTTDIPFPELSHHPLNTARLSRNYETEPKEIAKKQPQQHTRVTTYV